MLKIGGSVITDLSKPSTALDGKIISLLNEVKSALSEKDFDIIIGHGSGSFAHVAAKKYRTNEGFVDSNSRIGAAITHLSAKELNTIFVKHGLDLGMPLYPFSPAYFSLAKSKRLESGFVENIKTAMEKGFIPVVHGDVIIDSDIGVSIASTEEVIRFLSSKMRPSKVLFATDVDGVFTSNPKANKNSQHIGVISSENIDEAIKHTGVSDERVDVTGGMSTKLTELYEICKTTGAEGYIFNIEREGMLKDVLLGRAEEQLYTKVTG